VTEERKFAILFAATILAARKLIDRPEQTEYGERIFRGSRYRGCCVHPRTDRCAMAHDSEFVFRQGAVIDSGLLRSVSVDACARLGSEADK
jgi:hypothetical protein